jgi:hypothetical protein
VKNSSLKAFSSQGASCLRQGGRGRGLEAPAETLIDAQFVSGVSDETSPTRRESPVQFKRRLVIAFVRRARISWYIMSQRLWLRSCRGGPVTPVIVLPFAVS